MPTLKSIEDNIFVIKSCREWGISGPTNINNPSICARYVRDGMNYQEANEQCKRVRAKDGAILLLEREGYSLNSDDVIAIGFKAHTIDISGMNWRQVSRKIANTFIQQWGSLSC